MHWAVCSDLGPRSLLIIEVMSARVAGGPGNVPGRDLRRRFPDNQRQLQMAALSLSPARPTNQVQPAAGCPACTKCAGEGGGGVGDQRSVFFLEIFKLLVTTFDIKGTSVSDHRLLQLCATKTLNLVRYGSPSLRT